MCTVYGIIHIISRSFGYFCDHALVCRVYRIERVAIGRIDKLVVDEQLIGELDVHVVGPHRDCLVREFWLRTEAAGDADSGTNELVKCGGHVDVFSLDVYSSACFLCCFNQPETCRQMLEQNAVRMPCTLIFILL